MTDLDIAEDLSRPRRCSTPCRIFGCRSPVSLPVPPSVTPCRIDTLSSITTVSNRSTRRRCMVEENALAEARRRIDVHLEHGGDDRLCRVEREILATPGLPAGHARGDASACAWKALEIEQGLHQPPAGGVAVEHGNDVRAKCLADRGIAGKISIIMEGMFDQRRRRDRDDAGASAIRWTIGAVERVVVENMGQQEGGQVRLADCMASSASARMRWKIGLVPAEIDDIRRSGAEGDGRHEYPLKPPPCSMDDHAEPNRQYDRLCDAGPPAIQERGQGRAARKPRTASL